MDGSNSSTEKTSEETETADIRVAINTAINVMQAQLASKGSDAKGTISDLVKLLQLRKELEGERPRHVSVRWIDECENLR